MMRGSLPTEALDDEELTELVTTNKCLAMEKRDLHRQKLRIYSEKSVKLRGILRETSDPEERKCLQAKLKNLQQKQDAQITKLAKIDQIEKELDQFITEENQDSQGYEVCKSKKETLEGSENKSIHETPAQRLRTKSSIPFKSRQLEEPTQSAFSRNKGSFSRSKEDEELLLKDSRQVLEELCSNKLANKSSNPSRKSVKQKKTHSLFFNQNAKEEAQKPLNPVKLQWRYEQSTENDRQDYKCVPAVFSDFVEKVSKFWPSDLQNLLDYFKQSQIIRAKCEEQELYTKALNKREEKLRLDEERLKRSEQRVKKMEDSFQSLIEKQRNLMESIDKLEKQERALSKQIQVSLTAIANASKHISSSTFAVNEDNDPVKVDCFISDSVHKFSVDSFESFREGSTLNTELSKFQKGVQQYLMLAQRAVMIVSGELQQSQAKLSKAREQTTHLESRKKILQQQVMKVDHTLNKKKGFLKQIQREVSKYQEEAAQNGATAEIKKSLANQLQEKCEKLKLKKKSLGERVKNLEEELESLTLRKEQLFETVIQVEQQITGLKTYERELQTKIIFCERDKQNRESDIKMLEQKGEEAMKRVQQSNAANEEAIKQLNELEAQLTKIKEVIRCKIEEEAALADRARKLHQQLAQSTALLEQQTRMAQQQSEHVAQRSAEHLSIQSKISEATSKLRESEAQLKGILEQINEQKLELERGRVQLEEMLTAKTDLENLLHEVLIKKQLLINQIQQRSRQLQLLLSDLENGQADYQTISQKIDELRGILEEKQAEIRAKDEQCKELREDLDQAVQEETNILGRLGKLKEIERTVLLGIGAKGGSEYLDQQLKERVAQAVGQLASLNELKSQLKDCKYQNRKLKLQNQRLNKLIQEE